MLYNRYPQLATRQTKENEKYMNISRNKAKITTALVIFLLMTSAMIVAMPVQAQTTEIQVNTTAYLSFRPNPVGLGQTFLVNIWITPAVTVRRYVSGYTVTITKPNGTKDVVGPMDSYNGDATAWFEYVADQVGTWKLKFDFPGEHFNGTSGASSAAYYKPSSTKEQELVVQNEPVLSWSSPMPTDYWTRPVSPENREWVSIIGDYPYTGYMTNPPQDTNAYASNYRFTPYVQAPNTAHIVWKRLGALAGLMGGDMGQTAYGAGEGTYAGTPSIIFEGRCYQSVTKVNPTGSGTQAYLQCYDLRTGLLYWENPTSIVPTAISYVHGIEVVEGATHSQVGVGANLVAISGGRLYKWDAYTGALTVNVTAMSGTLYRDPYVLSVSGGRLINWTITGSSSTFTSRVVSNISFALSSLPSTCDFETGVAVIANPTTPSGLGAWYGSNIQAVSLITGERLWNITDTDTIYSSGAAVADHGKFAVCMMDRHWNCYDLNSGKKLWTSEYADYPWGWAWMYGVASAYGLIYGEAYDGIYAFDWDTGKIAWHFSAGDAGYETPYGTWSFMATANVADGKVYVGNGEHSPTSPLARGWRLFCINATTGKGIWNITGGMGAGAMADGYITADNRYDGYMYVFGKGKSATTVEAPLTAVTLGQSVMIKGTVLDQSSAQPGTPCVSAASMTQWMEYLHMQHTIPASVTGVSVSLDALDSNNNWEHIGDATTDGLSGTFGFMWEPKITGKYTVTATFMGDSSYGSSFATTYVGVVAAPEATATPEPQVIPDYTLSIVGMGIAIIIAVAIVGILILRKRA
jgi:outer membrane protein assembly factor BamB